MEKSYNINTLKDNVYTFDTRKGISYCIEIKKSNAEYFSTDNHIKFINLFSFNIFDKKEAIESDYIVGNTIVQFLLNQLLVKNNDSILFYINNEYDDTHFSHRAKSRLKLFRRLLRKANTHYNLEYIFLTNEHFVLNHKEYTIDYIGIIINSSSADYINIVRAFNMFCNDNSYQKNNN